MHMCGIVRRRHRGHKGNHNVTNQKRCLLYSCCMRVFAQTSRQGLGRLIGDKNHFMKRRCRHQYGFVARDIGATQSACCHTYQ